MTPSRLLAEIAEQPAAVRRLLSAEGERVAELGRRLQAAGIRFMVIAARGTSDNAARYGQYLFGALNRLPVALATPSLYGVYGCPPRLEGALVVGISQSGRSPDIVGVLSQARRQGVPTVALTNDPGSPLAAEAEHVIDLHAGPERSVAATKTYSAELAALALLALGMAGAEPPGPLAALPGAMAQALDAERAAQAAALRLAQSERCVVIGRGFQYATACEVALKVKELSYIAAEAYSAADFQHGPIAMIEPGFPAIVVDAGATLRAELASLRRRLAEQGATVVVLGDDEAGRQPGEGWLALPAGLPEWLAPLAAIVPGQLLAYHLALARGHDPDRPRSIRKVTLTQ